MFGEASNILKSIEELRSNLEDSRDNAIKQSNVCFLKEPKFSEAIRVLFWAVSAGYGGEIIKSEVEISETVPFLTMNCSNLLYETYQLNSYLNIYIKTIINGSEKIIDLLSKIEELVSKLEGCLIFYYIFFNFILTLSLI